MRNSIVRLFSATASAALAAGVVMAMSGGAQAATPLSVLTDVSSTYNMYIFGNIGSSGSPYANTDVEGKVAAGGNAYFTSFSIGLKDQGGVALTAGGHVSFSNGTIYGASYAGGTSTYSGASVGALEAGGAASTINASNGSYGAKSGNVTSPINFASTNASLAHASSILASSALQHVNGVSSVGTVSTSTNGSNHLILSSSATGIVFFDLTISQLVGIGGMDFSVNPAATVVVNVSGQTNKTIGNFSMSNSDADKTLFNFTNATQVNTSALGFEGSILAPHAMLDLVNGVVDGSIIGGNWDGNAQVNNKKYKGNLNPFFVAVPEPSTWAMMLTGVFGVGVAMRLARRSKLADRQAAL